MSVLDLPSHQPAKVSVESSGGAPELQVRFLNPVNHPASPPTDVAGGPAGSSIVAPELTPLAHGGYVLTWVDALSHSLQANYAVISATGKVVDEATYGSGLSSAFEALALASGGFALADAETDLFGRHGTLTFQTFGANGSPMGALTTVENETSPTGGLVFSDLEGAQVPAGIELAWNEPNGAHSILVEPNGTVVDGPQVHPSAANPVQWIEDGPGSTSLIPEAFGLAGPSHQAGWLV